MFAMTLTAKPPAIIPKLQPLRARKTIRLPWLRFCLSAPLRRQANAGNRLAPACADVPRPAVTAIAAVSPRLL